MQLEDGVKADKPLLVAAANYLDGDSAVLQGVSIRDRRTRLFHIAYPIGVIAVEVADDDRSATDCDRLASHPYDPQRSAPGVDIEALDVPRALAACHAAVATDPGEARHRYLRSRVESRASGLAIKAGKPELAQRYALGELADLAAAAVYPMAANNAANNVRGADDASADHRTQLRLEHLDRVLACCFAPVARHLIAKEKEHDPAQVRRVVRALLLWSAALGGAESHLALAELYTSLTLTPPDPATDAQRLALEHARIAERLLTTSGDTAAAQHARDLAARLSAGLAPAVLDDIAAKAAAFTPAPVTADPLWIGPL